MTEFALPRTRRSGMASARKRNRFMWAYIFILPQFVVFFGLTIYPIVMSYVYSFYNWNGLGPLTNYVGLHNYVRLFHDSQFWSDFQHTFEYMGGQTIIVMPLSLLMALVLNRSFIGGKTIYRTLYFLPVVTTTAIVGIIMSNIFGAKDALVNNLLTVLGLVHQPVPWLTNASLAMVVMIAVGSWKFFGIVMIYWLAGLQSIPDTLYEAASIDGAGFWRSLFSITLPLLKAVSVVILLLTVVNGLYVFDLVKTLTNGGPYFATETIGLFVYRNAFARNGVPRMGYASSAGILFGISVFFISIGIGWLIRQVNRSEKAGRRR